MERIKCPQCGKEVSDKDEKCIRCGCKIGQILNAEDNQQEQKQKDIPISICPECKKPIYSSTDNCPNCGCSVDLSNPMVCKINGVDYDLGYFYHELVELGRGAKIGRELREFVDLFETPALCLEILKTKKIPKEFNGQSSRKVVQERKKIEEAKPKIHCKYCGSDNVRKLGPFEKLAVQCIGKEWHCKKCNSDF